MNKRKTTQQFIEDAILKNGDLYDYSLVVYTNNKTKVDIVCKKHGIFKQSPVHHLEGNKCPKCSHESLASNKEEFVEKSIKIHGDLYGYSHVVYTNALIKVNIECKKHGIFPQQPKNHLEGKGCQKCANESQTSNKEEFIEKSIKIHGYIYDYSHVSYINNAVKVNIQCKKHGIFKQTPMAHLIGKGCRKCADESRTSNKEEFIEKSIKIHGDTYDYSNIVYINNELKIDITCKKHGIFAQQPRNHLSGKGCPRCSRAISKVSQKWLDYIGIPDTIGITREVWIQLDNNRKIKVDGYDPETNTVYEFHGDIWHGNLNVYDADHVNPINKKTMQQLLKETQERSRLIRDKGYNLKSIWESEWKKFQKELKKNE